MLSAHAKASRCIGDARFWMRREERRSPTRASGSGGWGDGLGVGETGQQVGSGETRETDGTAKVATSFTRDSDGPAEAGHYRYEASD